MSNSASPAANDRRGNLRLAWVAWSLMAIWAVVAFVSGLYDFVETTVDAHALRSMTSSPNPLPGDLGVTLWLLWLLITFNFAPVGLIVGVIAVVRNRVALPSRVIALLVLVVGMSVTEFAAPALATDSAVPGNDFVHDGRLSGLLIVMVALIFAAASYWVLPYLQRRPPHQPNLT